MFTVILTRTLVSNLPIWNTFHNMKFITNKQSFEFAITELKLYAKLVYGRS